MQKKILVTGSNGQLGREIREIAREFNGFDFVFSDLPEVDITDHQRFADFVKSADPAVILNCAAYTAVDKAEQEAGAARLVNIDAVSNMAAIASTSGIFLVHFSTDYIFGGHGNRPYRETDAAEPEGVYALTKLQGEEKIRESDCNYLIIRTSWLYSTFGTNFVKTILQKAGTTGKLRVVNDQVGSPTYAADLACATLMILPAAMEKFGRSTYHYANRGFCSWYEFALAIMRSAGIRCEITPVTTREYPTSATRPAYSVLDTSKIMTDFGLQIPGWQESMQACISKLKHQKLLIGPINH